MKHAAVCQVVEVKQTAVCKHNSSLQAQLHLIYVDQHPLGASYVLAWWQELCVTPGTPAVLLHAASECCVL